MPPLPILAHFLRIRGGCAVLEFRHAAGGGRQADPVTVCVQVVDFFFFFVFVLVRVLDVALEMTPAANVKLNGIRTLTGDVIVEELGEGWDQVRVRDHVGVKISARGRDRVQVGPGQGGKRKPELLL